MPRSTTPTSNHLCSEEIEALFQLCTGCGAPPEEHSCGFRCLVYQGLEVACGGANNDYDTKGEMEAYYTRVECQDCGTLFVERTLLQAIAVEETAARGKENDRT